MPSGGPPYDGRWPVSSVHEARLDNTWSPATFVVSWSPAPSAYPFTTGAYKGITFTASSTLTVSGGQRDVEYVVVAGGAGAYTPEDGGGGAGGMLTGTLPLVQPGNYPVSVGAGGPYADSLPQSQGSNSTFGPVTATGGGASGIPGGSGGGGTGPTGGRPTGGSGTPGQGNPGGPGGVGYPTPRPIKQGGPYIRAGAGGGGGGAGAAGSPGGPGNPSTPHYGGAGGNGAPTIIRGVNETLAGGGGGSGITVGGTGGTGGGGTGFDYTTMYYGSSGAGNTGGGAGGRTYGPGSYIPGLSSNGGSGVVIIRWLA